MINLLKQSEQANTYSEKPIVAPLLEKPIPLNEIPQNSTILQPTKAKKIEKAVEWGKKEVENWGEWLKEMDSVEKTRPIVDDALEAFKSHIAELYSHSFELVEKKSAFQKYVTQYKIEGVEGYGPLSFMSAVKPKILTFLIFN